MKLRWAIAVGILFVVALAGVAIGTKVLHQLPWEAVPDRISVCGRDFARTEGTVGSRTYTLAYVRNDGSRHLGDVATFRGSKEIWGRPEATDGTGCGLGVYLRTGEDSFVSYGLLGGP